MSEKANILKIVDQIRDFSQFLHGDYTFSSGLRLICNFAKVYQNVIFSVSVFNFRIKIHLDRTQMVFRWIHSNCDQKVENISGSSNKYRTNSRSTFVVPINTNFVEFSPFWITNVLRLFKLSDIFPTLQTIE